MPAVMSRAQLRHLPIDCRKTPPMPPAPPLPFAVMAYAFGQYCLPYTAKITRRKVRKCASY